MKIPFLIKQYISNDLEQSTFSKFFWYYPLNNEEILTNENSGIGMFIEILSGDLDFSLYEYITKRFWEVFRDNYYKRTFESALQRAVFTFLQLLQESGVQEGLDMNLAFFSITKESEDNYKLKLVRFGDLDIVLIRGSEYANLLEMAPNNTDFRNMEYLEIEIEPRDVILVGNHSLIINAIETGMIALTNYEDILNSLEEFKSNLYGAQKVLFLGIIEDEKISNEHLNQLAIQINSLKDKITASLREFKFKEKSKKFYVQVKKLGVNIYVSLKDKYLKIKLKKDKRSSINNEGTVVLETGNINSMKKESANKDKINQNVQGFGTSDTPGGYSGIKELDASVKDNLEVKNLTTSDQEDSLNSKKKGAQKTQSSFNSINNGGAVDSYNGAFDPLTEFKRRRSVTYKVWLKFKELVDRISVLSLSYIKRKGYKKSSFKVDNSLGLKPRGFKNFVPVIGVILLVLGAIYLVVAIKNAKHDKQLLKGVENVASNLQSFYTQNIQGLDGEDPEHMLELCFNKVDEASSKLNQVKAELKLKKNIDNINSLIQEVSDVNQQCTDIYDRIYHVIKIDNPTLLKDFSVELGANSKPVDMYIKSGVLEVLDAGKYAVYEVNIENGNILKLEDPKGLIISPGGIASSDKRVFVCDYDNGILFYDTDSKEFKQVTGTDPQSVNGKCNVLGAYAKNAYFTTQSGEVLYKSVFTDGAYALPSKYIKNVKNPLDIAIDGNIYILVKTENGVDIKKYFAGKFDSSFRLSGETLNTLGDIKYIYTNPSNEFPIYAYSATNNTIFVIEKPNNERHPGYGIIVKRYKLSNSIFNDVKSVVVYHSPHNNKELRIYVLNGSTIWSFPVQE